MAKWEPYDGYRTAINAARDTKVAVRHKANDSLPWQVMVSGRH